MWCSYKDLLDQSYIPHGYQYRGGIFLSDLLNAPAETHDTSQHSTNTRHIWRKPNKKCFLCCYLSVDGTQCSVNTGLGKVNRGPQRILPFSHCDLCTIWTLKVSHNYYTAWSIVHKTSRENPTKILDIKTNCEAKDTQLHTSVLHTREV